MKKLEKEVARNLQARFKTPDFHFPNGAEIHLPQMIEAGLSTPADFIDCNLDATKIVDQMITRFKEAEHKTPAMIEAYRHLYLPVLVKLMDDPRMHAVLKPAITRKQLRQGDSISAKLDKLATLPLDQLELLASRFDISGAADLSEYDLMSLLKLKAEEYRNLKAALAELARNVPQLGNVMTEALAQLEQGNTQAVRAIIADARQTLRDASLQKSLEQDADLVWVDAKALILMGDVQQAHDILTAAADSFASVDPLEPARRRARYFEPLYDHGLAFGGAGLGLAAEMLTQVLDRVKRHDDAPPWAATQNNLGNALAALGEREAGTETLMRAEAAYEAALLEWTRQAVPLDWAMTQGNLANLECAFFDKDGDGAHLDAAVAFLKAARQVFEQAGASQYLAMADEVAAGIAKRRE